MISEFFSKNSRKIRALQHAIEKLDIAASHDHVIICGQKISRPASLPPSQWLECWEPMQ